jgi:O-antigen ligase
MPSADRRWTLAVILLAAGLMTLIPWAEASGRSTAALWLDLAAHLAALGVVAVVAGASRRRLSRGLLGLWIPFGAVCLLSAWRAPYDYAAWLSCFEWAVALALGLALAAALSGKKGATWRLVLAWLVVLAGVPAALTAVLQVVTGGERGSAGFVNPNHLGAFLAALLPLAVVGVLAGRSRGTDGGRSHRWIPASLVSGVLALGVLATGSRAALLAVAVVGAFTLVTAAWHRWLDQKAVWVALLAVTIFGLAAGSVLWMRFADGTDIYRYDRLRIWPQAISVASQEPWLGVGPGQFRHVAAAHNFPREEAAVRFGRAFRSPHSHLLLVVAETGLLGLAALGLALVGTLRRARRRWRSGDRDTLPAAGAAALGLAVLAVISLFDEPLAHPPILLAAGILAGLALPPPSPLPEGRPTLARATALAAVATVALGAGILPAAAHHAALAASREPGPVRHAELLARARRFNPWQAFYPGEEAALLLAYARGSLDTLSYARIRTLADRAIELSPVEASFRLTRARLERRACLELFRDRPSCQRAKDDYEGAMRAAPTDPRILRESASFARLLQRHEDAVVLLHRAVELEPGYVRAWADLAAVLQDSGSGKEAQEAREGLRQAREAAGALVPDSDYARDILAGDAPPPEGGEGGGR